MLLDQRTMFVGCGLSSHVSSAADPDLLLAFPSQALNQNSDSRGIEEVGGGSREAESKGGDGFDLQKSDCVRGAARAGRDASDAIAYFELFCPLYKSYGLYGKCRHIS